MTKTYILQETVNVLSLKIYLWLVSYGRDVPIQQIYMLTLTLTLTHNRNPPTCLLSKAYLFAKYHENLLITSYLLWTKVTDIAGISSATLAELALAVGAKSEEKREQNS